MRMKKIITAILLCCAFWLNASPQQGKLINLGDYMEHAKPGDHTEVFRKAFEDLAKKQDLALYIPPGYYKVSDTIQLKGVGVLEIFGHGYAEIKMTDPEKDIFVSQHPWKMKIDGLSFIGGKNQISLENNNTDRTNIFITNCMFRDAGEFAIKLGRKMISAHVLIDQCSFYNNAQTLHTASDWVKLSNSWITSNAKMLDKAVIENYGLLTVEHVLGVPLTAEGVSRVEAKQRWIDNHGLRLTCRSVRFGGEGGGFPIVYNYRRYNLRYPASSIILEDCWLYCVNQMAINCIEVPNRIFVEKSTGMVDNTWVLKFRSDIDFSDLTTEGRKRQITIRIDRSATTRQTELPAALKDSYFGPECKIIP